MSSLPINTKPQRRNNKGRSPWAALGIAGAVIAVGAGSYITLRKPSDRPIVPTAASAEAIRTVAEGEAGTVGDLTITGEAMELAEIKVAPVACQVVNETLALSGVIEAGGDRIAKITPRVAGKVTRVFVVGGDTVRAGQTLALIESTDLARAQAAYQQAAARMTVAADALQRQRRLAELGAFGQPKVEEARRAAITAQSDSRTSENEVAGAQAGVREAESVVVSLRSALAQAQAQAKVTQSRLDRAGLLLNEQLISRQEHEQAQADRDRAQADVEAARAKIAQGQAQVETARAQVSTAQARRDAARKRRGIEAQALSREESLYQGGYATSRELVEAEAALQQARLDRQAATQAVRLLGGRPGNGGSVVAVTAPIAGQIQDRGVTLGETVDTEHSLFTLVNLGVVQAQLQVAPRDLSRVRAGEPVQLTVETAPGRIFVGKVTSVGSLADETTRAVPVRVTLVNKGGALRPGTFVRGGIVTNTRRARLVVPVPAIQEHTGRKTLYVAEGNQPGIFEVRHVKLGASATLPGGQVGREITEGLKGNERVAVSGTFYLKSEALKSTLSDGCCAVSTGKE